MNSINSKNPINSINLVLAVLLLCLTATNTYAELRTNMDADVVIGQPDFTSNSSGTSEIILNDPFGVFSDGKKLFIADYNNHRVLIYNSIPTSNNASADVVVGQPDFSSNTPNLGARGANTLDKPVGIFSDGKKLFIADYNNHRVLIFNSIPTSNNASADVVIGQPDFATAVDDDTTAEAANTLNKPTYIFSDGKKLFIADQNNNRVLIFNSIPTTNNASADVVIGQSNFSSNTRYRNGLEQANTLSRPVDSFSDGKRLFVTSSDNNRVLIWNSIPTSNFVPADVVVGQPDLSSGTANQGGNPAANTISYAAGGCTDGKRLFIADYSNRRVLIYNSIPTTNGASADIVIGQTDFATADSGTAADKLNNPYSVASDGKKLFVADKGNHRILIYNIDPLPAIKLGPQFEQGKAVLGKVFSDINRNGIQDKQEQGIEGVKVASDTGIYAITDEDGKYHYPYIETGQHLLKIDSSTLPEGSILTTDSPRKITVTKGVLTKVSFGVKLPPEAQLQEQSKEEGPFLKVSITQDPVLLKPKLAIKGSQTDKDTLTFDITCNYFLFIERSILTIYDNNYKRIKTIPLPKPIPSKYTLPIKDLPPNQETLYYQLSVYDKHNKEDRTGVGSFELK